MAQATLRTRRLLLVPLAEEHLEHEVELDSDPEVMRYLTGRASSRERVERQHRNRLAVARRAPGFGLWVGFAETMVVNPASRATMASIGMRHVQTFHLEWDDPLPGSDDGETEYAITREQWRLRAHP